MSKKLSNDDFGFIIKNTPLVSFDMIISFKNKYLLGKRINEPAKNYFFVPGGRIFKDETIENACIRLSKKELNIELSLDKFKFHMNTNHIYPNNFFDNKFSTHYVVLSYLYNLTDDEYGKINMDDQHSEICWMTKDELFNRDDVHNLTKRYFE